MRTDLHFATATRGAPTRGAPVRTAWYRYFFAFWPTAGSQDGVCA